MGISNFTLVMSPGLPYIVFGCPDSVFDIL